MANPENKQIPYESTQKDIRDAIESVATAIGGITHPDAEDIVYDNSVSGLSATDVQNAIDEVYGDIPTVNNGTLTIQQNGTSKGSFTANSASNVNVNIETPTADKKTATDQFATADGGLLSKCQINLVPVQSGSGDPSPDNIRPISGHTEVDLQVNGKNWVNITANAKTDKGITFTPQSDGGIRINGTATDTVYYYPCGSPIPAIWLNKSFILSGGKDGVRVRVYHYDGTNNASSESGAETSAFTFTSESGTIDISVFSGATVDTVVYPMLRLSTDTDSTFEPYLGHLYQVQIGSTVYGGYVDLVSGVMIVDREYVDLNSLTWTYRSDLQIFQTTDVGFDYSLDTSKVNISSCYLYNGIKTSGSGAVSVNPSFSLYTNNRYMWIRDTRYADPTAFTNSLLGQKAVLYLATPQTIQLTPQQIEALVGQNNLSCPLEGQSLETNGTEYKELFTFADVKEYVETGLNTKVDKTDNVLSYGYMLSTTDGKNYKITVSSMDASRFSFMILVGSQSSAVAIIQCAVNNSGGANSIAFSDARATYDQGTKIITVDAGANAWTAPNVIYPKSRITFS